MESQWAEYGVAAAMLVLALLFPIGLMIFNPTLMFERGWEQYVGTGIYFWAVLTLGRELLGPLAQRAGLRGGARAAQAGERRHGPPGRRGDGSAPVATDAAMSDDERRILPRRVRQLTSYHPGDAQPLGHPAHGGQPRELGPRPGADGRAGSR